MIGIDTIQKTGINRKADKSLDLLADGRRIYLKKVIFSCYLKIKNLFISMTEFHKIHLMDVITYKGQKCFVNNGTKCDSNGNILWDILPEKIDENGRRSGWSVPRSEFKRVFCWFNIKNALFSRYYWWKSCWYEIQLREMMDT